MINNNVTQLLVETMYNKHQAPLLIDNFLEGIEPADKKVLSKLLSLKDASCSLDTLVGMCGRNPMEHAVALDNIFRLADEGLINITLLPTFIKVSSPVKLPKNIQDLINQYMYLPPMLCEPKTIRKNSDNGYLSVGKSSILLNGKYHECYQNLDAINMSNRVAMSVNTDVIKAVADNRESLRQAKVGESAEDFQKRRNAFCQFTLETMKVAATMVNNDNKFYFNHEYDHRGRTYCHGYHLSYQGNDYRKAILELHDRMELDGSAYGLYSPLDELRIDIANSYGLDKKQYPERLAWFHANEHQLLSIPSKDIEEEAVYTAGVLAYQEAVMGNPIGYTPGKDATASGMQILAVLTRDVKAASICNVINDYDANGNAKRCDPYTIIYEVMQGHAVLLEQNLGKTKRNDLKDCIMTGLYGSTASPKRVLGDGTLALELFPVVMEEQSPYAWRARGYLLDIWSDKWVDYRFTMPDGHVTYDVVEDDKAVNHIRIEEYTVSVPYTRVAPMKGGKKLPANVAHSTDAYIVRELKARAKWNKEDLLTKLCILEDTRIPSHIAKSDELAYGNQVMEDTGIVSIHWLKYVTDTNAWILSSSVRQKLIAIIYDLLMYQDSFDVLTVHDCFKAHPNHIGYVHKLYNDLLAEIVEGNLLQNVVRELTGHKIHPGIVANMTPEQVKAFANEIRKSVYSIC